MQVYEDEPRGPDHMRGPSTCVVRLFCVVRKCRRCFLLFREKCQNPVWKKKQASFFFTVSSWYYVINVRVEDGWTHMRS